ncbi:non-canonical purine NTP pyrophosphatase, rdgB/HAM1 family [Staphylothermus marinus F1]|uniref:dITP/XTP pyrophosphatase n=1 Tax=Staphylothermus marinus (strain ATCC 43588 / DSM 3639 / JCM 9404 / F1) TaxID=399550 RepID=A3DMT1_STAMF|nr:XTP/dITP diphosphatase [Staphylothermus marinus]ABN69941.1 non-canonical purine NTP pyrophosphatase, rdgB/HAM1 family [Staphylothermus marinus F1]
MNKQLEPIYFITGNKHKLLEVKPIAEKYGFILVQSNYPKQEIQDSNILNIARHAALNAYMNLKKPVLVEDAGLFIDALKGFPGPYSSYVFKTIGITGILKLMENIVDRKACFKSAVVLIYEPFMISVLEKTCGIITRNPRGEQGFGFDPIFIPKGSSRTFAEMSIDEKNKYSHRAKAVEKAFSTLKQYFEKRN